MKIIKCYIENFGCLQEFTYDFEEGLTTINEMNGWGKSTFAAFIRAMFYGIPGSGNKKNLDEKERIKYNPWQGGRMGGNLVFTLQGKDYKLERSFGKKEKDDTFILYDNKTNIESFDYTSNIGEEIFGIDREAYAKSAYISQNEIGIGTNDSINAKLGNLLDSDNDINNFDTAIKKLSEAKKKYKMVGKRGTIAVAEQKIAEKKILLEKKQSIKEALEERMKQVNVERDEKEVLQNKLIAVKEKVNEAAKYGENKEKKKQYDSLVLQINEKINQVKQIQDFFKDERPSKEDLKVCQDAITILEQLRGEQKSYLLTSEEMEILKMFEERIAEGVFSEESLNAIEERNRKNQDLQIKIEDGKLTEEENKKKEEGDQIFRNGTPSEDEISKYTSYIPEIHQLETEIARNEGMRKKEGLEISNKKNPRMLILLFSIFFIIASVVLISVSFQIYGFLSLLSLLVGMFLLFLFLVQRKKIVKQENEEAKKLEKELENEKHRRNELIQKHDDLETKLDHFIKQFMEKKYRGSYMESLMWIREKTSNYGMLIEKTKRMDYKEIEEERKEHKKRIQSFLKSMNETEFLKEEFWSEGLKNIRRNYNVFLSLREKKGRLEKNKEKIESYEQLVYKFLNKFKIEQKDENVLAFEEIKKKKDTAERLENEIIELQKQKTEKSEQVDFAQWKLLETKDLDLEHLREEERDLEAEKDETIEREKKIQQRIDEKLAEFDGLKEVEDEVLELEEQKEKDQEKLEVLEGTIKYLLEAKELFSSHYLKGLRKSFEKYMDMIGSTKLEGAIIDAKMEVKINRKGALRHLDSFSRGNKDLVNVCARFALIDALFEQEKPFVILDDTFVNFDKDVLKKVLELLQEIASTYQVIYLICHESRAI